MNDDLIKAHLNLYAVLQNLEDLVQLDAKMTQLTTDWDISIQFSVRNGPAAHIAFQGGGCTHGVGQHPKPAVKLFFTSPKHLNDMFAGTASPIPLKGFTRLGFLKSEFPKLTDRLSFYLKPAEQAAEAITGAPYRKISTILTLHTAAYAVKVLAQLEPASQQIAASIPTGALELSVLPDGPHAHVVFNGRSVSAGKTPVERPMAKMLFRDLDAANDLLSGRVDSFRAVAQGDTMLRGQIPIIDGVGLILDRIGQYLA